MLTRCIQTMTYLEELHNFNGIMEFIAALQNAGVFRLKETWARLDKKHKRAWDMLTARLSRDNNFKVFRESLRTVSPPSIPYLGLFLTDMTFVEEVEKKKKKKKKKKPLIFFLLKREILIFWWLAKVVQLRIAHLSLTIRSSTLSKEFSKL